ncbi:short-chain dehydrogenase/reductase [Conexibacter sp. DBS9H8]|uniref:short-chain dehydrogenase/reductase n=1 Tax=Conexibacter sp. DBS9H8 TaxID=2937801 RepID=UPI002010083A|nr:short-chain dehydrogenase/reductase [Conexibacter sp. DBS9H8]
MPDTPWNVAGRTVLVTGAARGIGENAARRLHALGMNVVLAGLEPNRLARISEELGSGALGVECDVTSREALRHAVAVGIEQFGGIDVVVANAGVNAIGSVAGTPPERWERVLEIDLLGVVRTVQATLPHVIERRGYVLPVASLAAAVPIPLSANYTAAKHGVNGFAHALRAEVRSLGVDVGCAYFGLIDTDLVRRSSADPATEAMRAAMPSFLDRPIPVARAGEAIAEGVMRRRKRVYAPRWILPALVAPGVFIPIVERIGTRSTAQAIAIAMERERRGDHGADTIMVADD